MHQCHLPWLHPIRIAKALESKSLDLVVKLLLRPHSMLKTVSLDKCLVSGSHKSQGVQTINWGYNLTLLMPTRTPYKQASGGLFACELEGLQVSFVSSWCAWCLLCGSLVSFWVQIVTWMDRDRLHKLLKKCKWVISHKGPTSYFLNALVKLRGWERATFPQNPNFPYLSVHGFGFNKEMMISWLQHLRRGD